MADVPQAILRADANASELEVQRLRSDNRDHVKAAAVASVEGIKAVLDKASATDVRCNRLKSNESIVESLRRADGL